MVHSSYWAEISMEILEDSNEENAKNFHIKEYLKSEIKLDKTYFCHDFFHNVTFAQNVDLKIGRLNTDVETPPPDLTI